jgi:hypothetical protein
VERLFHARLQGKIGFVKCYGVLALGLLDTYVITIRCIGKYILYFGEFNNKVNDSE